MIPKDVIEAARRCYDALGRGSISDSERIARAILAEREKGETFKAQAYQVIGMLLDKAGIHESDEGVRALDYFAYAEAPDEEFLPWPIDQTYSNPAYVPVKVDP